MRKRKTEYYPRSPWNAGTLVNLAGTIFTSAALFGGFYFLTQWRLTQVETGVQVEQKNREHDRSEFATKFDTMGQSLASLDKHAAVQDETLKTISAQLGAYLQQRR